MRINIIKIIASKSRYILMALVLAFTAAIARIPLSESANAAIGSITQYSVPYAQTYPNYLTLGPDNNIWYSGFNFVGKVTPGGTVTQYMHLGYHYGITKGSDGNLWFGAYNSSTATGSIVAMTSTGSVVGQYTIPGYAQQAVNLALGPDGNVWFTYGGNGQKIGKITPSGTITQYSVPYSGGSGGATIQGIAAGPDGNMWFTITTSGSSSAVGKITSAGVVTNYTVPTNGAGLRNITAGPDGNMWFTERGGGKIGKITMAGIISEFIAPLNSLPYGITTGSDGSLWFTQEGSGEIGRMTTTGVVTEYVVPGAGANTLGQIVAGSDGAAWFATNGLNKIGRIATQLTSQSINFTSSAPTNAVVGGPGYTPTASATSGLAVSIAVDGSASGICSIDGLGKVTYQNAGSCVLNANQAGDNDYSAAIQVQQVIIVLPVDADSSVSVSCPTTANIGDTVVCTISVANTGPAVSQNATLTAVYSNGLTNASISGGGAMAGQIISWNAAAYSSSSTDSITLTATASAPGKLRLNAALLQTSPDPNTTNNTGSAVIDVL